MQDIKSLSDTELIDLLALETSKYIDLLHGGVTKDQLNHCGALINSLQEEIETRKVVKLSGGSDRSNDTDQMDQSNQLH